MSESKKYQSGFTLAQEEQTSWRSESDSWKEDCENIVDILEQADRPLPSKEIAFRSIMLSQPSVVNRLNTLISDGRVRVREDGPDGRVTYYEATSEVHAHCDEYWLPKPLRLE